MTNLLARLFVRDYQNTTDPRVRARYGTMVSVVCILTNLLLSAGKMLVGILIGSIAITADGVNNLSDAGSSIVSLVSFRISGKPADRDHPFGHARIEYVASMIVSFLVLLVGFELLRDSLDKVFAPVSPDKGFLVPTVVVLAASILVKLWMFFFNRKIGTRINAPTMRGAAADSLADCAATSAVLVSTLLYALTDINLDAYFGILVALGIFVAGCKLLNETKNSILGEKPIAETTDAIRRIVGEYPEALGIHDLIVHNYGPGHTIASLHIEVDGGRDVFETHDTIDNIERRLGEELGIQATIHADPIVIGDPVVDALSAEMSAAAAALYDGMCIHDFRFVRGITHSNLIFDVAVPFECKMTDEEVRTALGEAARALDSRYRTVITVDKI